MTEMKKLFLSHKTQKTVSKYTKIIKKKACFWFKCEKNKKLNIVIKKTEETVQWANGEKLQVLSLETECLNSGRMCGCRLVQTEDLESEHKERDRVPWLGDIYLLVSMVCLRHNIFLARRFK